MRNKSKLWSDYKCSINNFQLTVPSLSFVRIRGGGGNEDNSVVQNGQQNAGDKAKQELQKVSAELAKLIAEIGKSNNDFKSKQFQAMIQEHLLSVKFLYLDSWLKFLKIQTEKLEEELTYSSESANELIQIINYSNQELTSQYNNYTKLKKQEASLHYWHAKLKEHLLKKESDLAREVKFDL